MQITQLAITGMVCDSCRAAVEEAILALPEVISAEIDLDSGQAIIKHEDGFDPAALGRAVARAGYQAQVVEPPVSVPAG